MIPELTALSYPERLNRLNLWTLDERHARAELIEAHKMVHGLSTISF